MTANELRIGNWVLLNNKPIKVESINVTGINLMAEGGYYAGEASFGYEGYFLPYFGNKTDIVEPIPFAPDILLKCGFQDCSERRGDKNFLGNIITEDWIRYIIGVKENEDGSYTSDLELELEEDGTWSMDYYRTKLKYLHQLQNLYFSLTNNELNIKGL